MAQTVTINNASYSDVPYVLLNKTDGAGQAKFVDTSDATATASDIVENKIAYVDGEKIVGTARDASDIATSEEIQASFKRTFG